MIHTDPQTRLRRMKIWAPIIQEVAVLTGENRERLMALCWRESWCGFAPGYNPKGSPVGWGDDPDGSGVKPPFAFGLCQIDRRYHSDFIKRELGRYHYAEFLKEPYSPREQFLYAAGLLREAREWFKRSSLSIKGETLERATHAAYNAGISRVSIAIRSAPLTGDVTHTIDSVTTGKDYSGYIFALAAVLQRPGNQWIWTKT